MSDIVERLREGVWGRTRRADAVIHANMQDGADEIERLRAALLAAKADEYACHTDAVWDKINAALGENNHG